MISPHTPCPVLHKIFLPLCQANPESRYAFRKIPTHLLKRENALPTQITPRGLWPPSRNTPSQAIETRQSALAIRNARRGAAAAASPSREKGTIPVTRRTIEQIREGLIYPETPLWKLPTNGTKLVAIANSVDSIGADQAGEMREYYMDIVCPERPKFLSLKIYQWEPDWWVMFSCGLVMRSHLRRLGVRDNLLGLDKNGISHPYLSGLAVNNLEVVARQHGAWRTGGIPSYGAPTIIGTGPGIHVLLLKSDLLDVPEQTSTSEDGGQALGAYRPGKSYGGILEVERTVRQDSKKRLGFFDKLGKRPLYGWIDPEALRLDAAPTYDLV